MSDTGRNKSLTEDEVLTVLRGSDELYLSTSEVAEQVDASRPTVLKRLDSLHEAGAVEKKSIGRSNAWHLPERENFRIGEFINETEIDASELRDLIESHPPERITKAIEILQQNDDLEDDDIDVLKTAASALGRGQDRDRVTRTLETDEPEPGRAGAVARFGLVALLLGAVALLYGTVGALIGLPAAKTIGAIGLLVTCVGILIFGFGLFSWYLRRIGRDHEIVRILRDFGDSNSETNGGGS